jgi:hypothetical protein
MTRHEFKEEKSDKRPRKFGGKVFHRYGTEKMTKSGAEAYAEHLRNRGYHARVVKEYGENEWLVFARKK